MLHWCITCVLVMSFSRDRHNLGVSTCCSAARVRGVHNFRLPMGAKLWAPPQWVPGFRWCRSSAPVYAPMTSPSASSLISSMMSSSSSSTSTSSPSSSNTKQFLAQRPKKSELSGWQLSTRKNFADKVRKLFSRQKSA